MGNNKPENLEGVLCYLRHKVNNDTGAETTKILILDDKNLAGETLSQRRLLLATDPKVELFKLTYAVFFLGDLIKLATSSMWFIDSLGKLFKYKKTTRAILKMHRLKNVHPITGGGAVVEVYGITTRFKSLYPPDKDTSYVGLLHFGKSLVLYGFYNKLYDDTWRNV